MRRERPFAASEFRRTDVGEFRIHSEHIGDGPDVVLLHGLSGSRRWWRYTAPVLARSYRVHMPELIGFGGSRATRQPGIREMAEIMAGWLDTFGIGGHSLVGHSMGGQIAIHMAAEHRMPERLGLVCASGLPRAVALRDAAMLLAGAIPPRAWGAPTFLPIIAVDALRAGPRALLRATQHLLSDDVRPLLRGVTCPTLVVWGEYDPLIPLAHGRAFVNSIPGARLIIVAGAAHNPMADRPAEFNRILLDFLGSPA